MDNKVSEAVERICHSCGGEGADIEGNTCGCCNGAGHRPSPQRKGLNMAYTVTEAMLEAAMKAVRDDASFVSEEQARRIYLAMRAADPEREMMRSALEQAAEAMTCRREDYACYCPNCDNSLHDARAKARAALSPSEHLSPVDEEEELECLACGSLSRCGCDLRYDESREGVEL